MANSSNVVKGYVKSLMDKIVVQGIWTSIAAIVGAVITFILSRKFNYSNLEIALLITIVVMLVGIVSFLIYRRTNKRLPIFDSMDCDFYMVREERIHKWTDEENYTHKRRYTLRALKNNVTHYTDKFQWTGKEFTLSGGNADYTIEQDKNSKNVFDVYHFKFTTPLKKNGIIEVEASWKAKGPAKPFFSTQIEEPTDLLLMTVMLYPGCGVFHVNCDIESYKGARAPIVSKKEKLNSDGEYSWQVEDPKLLHHYEINWKK